MKVVILNSKGTEQDIFKFGNDLLEKLKSRYEVVMRNEIQPDFSNIPELYDDDEKIVLFNPFSFKEGFDAFKLFSKELPNFKNIKYLFSTYSFYTGLDLAQLKKMGIRYRNNGGANADSVAQWAIASIYALLSRFPELSKSKQMADGSILGEELEGKTAGVIGMGNVGQSLLATLEKMGIRTVYTNRTAKDVSAKQVGLEKLVEQDLIFITIATNDETKEMLTKLSTLLKSHNYVIDVSHHDDLYDKKAVLSLLNEGKIKGFALEAEESMESDKNFIITHGIAWCTQDAERKTIENYLNFAFKVLEGRESEIDFII